ncbi:carbohydrate ABC transporter permease [Tessaracoccus massiliensis]|uniref:carbohydrate ABC transporter permease n=1 Tax=Tessaracoccus massiliensis TaxID=1522311 RepID=UPI000694D980|nr:sugar ABC transporter permease [Tessaracoccus massiliensis]
MSSAAVTGAEAAPPRKGWRARDRYWGMFFVAPQALGMLTFTLIPFVFAFLLAFTEWNGFGMPQIIGFDNFRDQLTSPLLGRAIINTLVIAAVTVPVGLFLSIVGAVLLNKIKGRPFYLVLFFAPVVTSSIAVALIWQQLLRPDGVISGFLTNTFGIPPIDWLGHPWLALLAVCVVTVWSSLGLNIVIFMAGLQSISPSVLEAAAIDGAGPLARFFKVILPLLSPIVFYQSVVAFISSLQTFDLVFVLVPNAGPDNGTRTIVYHIYDLGFAKSQFGLSSAASIVLLVLTLLITAMQFGAQKKFVHYEG